MKKLIIMIVKALLVLVFGLFIFIQVQKPEKSNANFNKVEAKVIAKLEEYGLEKQENIEIKRTFSIDPSLCENIAYYKSGDAMDVREVLIVEYDQESFSKTFETVTRNRVDAQINAFDGYGPEQVKLLKGAKIYTQVNYAIYVTSENSDAVVKAFKDAL